MVLGNMSALSRVSERVSDVTAGCNGGGMESFSSDICGSCASSIWSEREGRPV